MDLDNYGRDLSARGRISFKCRKYQPFFLVNFGMNTMTKPMANMDKNAADIIAAF